MALLVFLNRAPDVSGADAYKPSRGDVIAVLPDGRSAGTKVTAEGGFYQIQVEGPPEAWSHLLAPVVEQVRRPDGEIISVVTQSRANRLNSNRLSPSEQEALDQGILNLEVEKVDEVTEVKSKPGRADLKGRISTGRPGIQHG